MLPRAGCLRRPVEGCSPCRGQGSAVPAKELFAGLPRDRLRAMDCGDETRRPRPSVGFVRMSKATLLAAEDRAQESPVRRREGAFRFSATPKTFRSPRDGAAPAEDQSGLMHLPGRLHIARRCACETSVGLAEVTPGRMVRVRGSPGGSSGQPQHRVVRVARASVVVGRVARSGRIARSGRRDYEARSAPNTLTRGIMANSSETGRGAGRRCELETRRGDLTSSAGRSRRILSNGSAGLCLAYEAHRPRACGKDGRYDCHARPIAWKRSMFRSRSR